MTFTLRAVQSRDIITFCAVILSSFMQYVWLLLAKSADCNVMSVILFRKNTCLHIIELAILQYTILYRKKLIEVVKTMHLE